MRSPIRWVGGKGRLVNTLLPLFPSHKGYVEVFGGSAVVLLNKKPSKWEVLNDFDGNLVNFWKVVQQDKDEFIQAFEYEVVSRERFNEYKEKYKTGTYKDEIDRAKVFYYIVKSGFGGDMMYPVFGTAKDRNRLRLEQIEQDINDAYMRIQKVTIENRSFEKIIQTYDSKDTLFFLDPPYRKTKQYKTGAFTDEHYKTLRDLLAESKGDWLVTINDDPYIRDLFKAFHIQEHGVPYSISKSNTGRERFGELIITNYDMEISSEEGSHPKSLWA